MLKNRCPNSNMTQTHKAIKTAHRPSSRTLFQIQKVVQVFKPLTTFRYLFTKNLNLVFLTRPF